MFSILSSFDASSKLWPVFTYTLTLSVVSATHLELSGVSDDVQKYGLKVSGAVPERDSDVLETTLADIASLFGLLEHEVVSFE